MLLTLLLLVTVVRSLLIPLVASVMNLLSIGAALGALNAVFNWGWAVVGSFLLGHHRQLQEFGFGLALSVLVDALLIRSLAVPAIMHLIGPANWALPPGSTASCLG